MTDKILTVAADQMPCAGALRAPIGRGGISCYAWSEIFNKEVVMLVITLRSSEAIRIGDEIRVSIERIERHESTELTEVKFGIDAPVDVLVLRSELSVRRPPPEES
ncbi:carbon storage regulator [Povalibacter sp.]|uniref:carbon storage regulator n=1 Tax=Povalibacter sp. TaxID=1962978 RepID=UPI002F421A50